MTSNDIGYYRQRALEERELEKSAADRGIAMIHRQLAEEYEALVSDFADTRRDQTQAQGMFPA